MILTHFRIKPFGIGTYSVRFLPLLFNAFTVLFIYLAGKRFFGFWAGMIDSGMFVLYPNDQSGRKVPTTAIV